MLAVATLPTRTSLDWHVGEPASDASDAPGIELDVIPAGTGARESVSSFSICPPRLEADVEVNLRTTDSSLVSTFPGTLLADAPGSARIVEDVEGPAVSASGFGSDVRLSLNAVFTRLGAYGSLSLEGSATDVAISTEYAQFPDTRACNVDAGWRGLVVPENADLGGFDASSSLALLSSHLPTRVVWEDSSETALALSVSASSRPCATLAPPPSSEESWLLSYPVTLDAASEDGRWSGRYSGIVSAEPLDGGFVLASLRVQVQTPSGEFAAASGVPAVDVSAFESGILDLAIDVDTARGATRGELDIGGLAPGSCLPSPDEPPAPGRLYTTPCDGVRRQPVLRGTFGG
jgi:hypothetical protein